MHVDLEISCFHAFIGDMYLLILTLYRTKNIIKAPTTSEFIEICTVTTKTVSEVLKFFAIS
jgi:hypothetical protein